MSDPDFQELFLKINLEKNKLTERLTSLSKKDLCTETLLQYLELTNTFKEISDYYVKLQITPTDIKDKDGKIEFLLNQLSHLRNNFIDKIQVIQNEILKDETKYQDEELGNYYLYIGMIYSALSQKTQAIAWLENAKKRFQDPSAKTNLSQTLSYLAINQISAYQADLISPYYLGNYDTSLLSKGLNNYQELSKILDDYYHDDEDCIIIKNIIERNIEDIVSGLRLYIEFSETSINPNKRSTIIKWKTITASHLLLKFLQIYDHLVKNQIEIFWKKLASDPSNKPSNTSIEEIKANVNDYILSKNKTIKLNIIKPKDIDDKTRQQAIRELHSIQNKCSKRNQEIANNLKNKVKIKKDKKSINKNTFFNHNENSTKKINFEKPNEFEKIISEAVDLLREDKYEDSLIKYNKLYKKAINEQNVNYQIESLGGIGDCYFLRAIKKIKHDACISFDYKEALTNFRLSFYYHSSALKKTYDDESELTENQIQDLRESIKITLDYLNTLIQSTENRLQKYWDILFQGRISKMQEYQEKGKSWDQGKTSTEISIAAHEYRECTYLLRKLGTISKDSQKLKDISEADENSVKPLEELVEKYSPRELKNSIASRI